MARPSSPDDLTSEMNLLLEGDISINCSPEVSSEECWDERRNLVAYWLLGLCNNYGYVVMLSAAHDILDSKGKPGDIPDIHNTSTNPRDCNQVSTGAILLADILPALFIKLIAPFLPFHVHLRVLLVILLSASGFVLVAASKSSAVAVLGVVATSLGSGLGEVTFMSYSALFQSNVVSTWSSGTGGAGLFGSLSYAGLTSLGLSPSTSIYVMLVVPAIMAFTFWGVLLHPRSHAICCTRTNRVEVAAFDKESYQEPLVQRPEQESTWRSKLRMVPPLFKFMLPLGAVYFLEYFINQGLFELIYFQGIWLDHHEQYRWLQVDYQIGVFISRSSVNLFQIKQLWLLALLQGLNVVLFTTEVVTYIVPTIWIIFLAVLWEGLLGGASYVNTFYQITQTVPPERREFSLGITCLSDAVGITLAGFAAIPAHNFLCALPLPNKS